MAKAGGGSKAKKYGADYADDDLLKRMLKSDEERLWPKGRG